MGPVVAMEEMIPLCFQDGQPGQGMDGGENQRVCSQRELNEGQANKEGMTKPWLKQEKIDNFRSNWSL